jgi:hypothetical protein
METALALAFVRSALIVGSALATLLLLALIGTKKNG